MFRMILLAAVLGCLLVGGAALCDDASLRDAWLHAPKAQGANWNRLALLHQLLAGGDLAGKPRAKVLAILGPPGYSAVDYPQPSRIDMYRLSAANDQSLRIDYEPQDAGAEDMIEQSPCSCDVCTADAAVVPAAVLAKNRLVGSSAVERTLTMSEFEKMLGRQGQLHVSHRRAGMVWLNYVETWRVEGAPHQFLSVSGHVPLRDAPMDEVGDKRVESWAVISFAPDCVAP